MSDKEITTEQAFENIARKIREMGNQIAIQMFGFTYNEAGFKIRPINNK